MKVNLGDEDDDNDDDEHPACKMKNNRRNM